MFANPLWSALLLAVPVALYFLVIRPRLRPRLAGFYDEVDSFWERARSLIYRFRTFLVGVAGVALTALPDLLVLITPLDFSPFLPQPWPAYTGPITSAVLVLMRAFETKSNGEA